MSKSRYLSLFHYAKLKYCDKLKDAAGENKNVKNHVKKFFFSAERKKYHSQRINSSPAYKPQYHFNSVSFIKRVNHQKSRPADNKIAAHTKLLILFEINRRERNANAGADTHEGENNVKNNLVLLPHSGQENRKERTENQTENRTVVKHLHNLFRIFLL